MMFAAGSSRGRTAPTVVFWLEYQRGRLNRRLHPDSQDPAMYPLSEHGIPVSVMAAPIIPMINDMELDAILEAAA